MPEFSIITPTRNSAPTLNSCLESVAGQRADLEHIVVDGGSTDGTGEMLAELAPAARVIGREPDGIYSAINTGLRAAQGDIVGILNADDFYPSNDVLVRVSERFRDPQTQLVYGDLCYVDRNEPGRLVRYWKAGAYDQGRFTYGWMPPHPTLFVRRGIYRQYGAFRTDLGTSADYEFMLRLMVRHQLQALYIPEVLVHMRTGGASNSSLKARLKANQMDRQAWKVNELTVYPWTTWLKPARKIKQWWVRP